MRLTLIGSCHLPLCACRIAGNVELYGPGTTGDFYNVTFRDLHAWVAPALGGWWGEPDDPLVYNCYGCKFIHCTSGLEIGTAVVGWWSVVGDFYDCLWYQNTGMALLVYESSMPNDDHKTEIVRCRFIENVGSTNSWPGTGAVLVVMAGGLATVVDTVFLRNTSPEDGTVQAEVIDGGAACALSGAAILFRNVSFLSNKAYNGGAFAAHIGAKLTCINCVAVGNSAHSQNGAFMIKGESELTVINSSFTESSSEASNHYIGDGSTFVAINSVFNDNFAMLGQPGFLFEVGGDGTLIDCTVSNNHANSVGGGSGAILLSSAASVHLVRTTLRDNSVLSQGGCMKVQGSSSAIIEDSEAINCYSDGYGGFAIVSSDSTMVVKNSRLIGNRAAGNGAVFTIMSGASLRVTNTIIANSSGGDPFAIHDTTGVDFSVQLDTVDVDETIDLFSTAKVLVQNCDGLETAAAKNGTVASCESTGDYCLRDSCIDNSVGIQCICMVNGQQQLFPPDCMQSAVIDIPVPSTKTLTYLVEKPFNSTAELVLANTGEASMAWTMVNVADDLGEVSYFMTPSFGDLPPFGEIVVKVIARTTGLNARSTPYRSRFALFSQDVCVCREQQVEMNVEIVVTAKVSAANSYIELIDADNVNAAGVLYFYIVPVDDEGMKILNSADIQFVPVIAHLEEEEIEVTCAVYFVSELDKHRGSCAMPYHLKPRGNGGVERIPLSGKFNLSVGYELDGAVADDGRRQLSTYPFLALVGATEYMIDVTSCPSEWYYDVLTARCRACDLEKSVCRGGRELPVPKKGFWSDLENSHLGYVYTCVTLT